MTSKERESIFNELLTMTTYTRHFFESKSDNELYGMYTEIKAKINKYIHEIMVYEKNNNINPPYTLEDLCELTYNDLILIRQEYGLSRKKKQNQKEIKPQYQQKEQIYNYSVYQESRELQIISIEEARMMYGLEADLMDENQYQRCGFQLDSDSYSKKYPPEEIELRREIVYVILNSRITDENDEPYQEYYLELCSMDQLRTIYEAARRNIPRSQPFEQFVQTLKRKIGS